MDSVQYLIALLCLSFTANLIQLAIASTSKKITDQLREDEHRYFDLWSESEKENRKLKKRCEVQEEILKEISATNCKVNVCRVLVYT